LFAWHPTTLTFSTFSSKQCVLEHQSTRILPVCQSCTHTCRTQSINNRAVVCFSRCDPGEQPHSKNYTVHAYSYFEIIQYHTREILKRRSLQPLPLPHTNREFCAWRGMGGGDHQNDGSGARSREMTSLGSIQSAFYKDYLLEYRLCWQMFLARAYGAQSTMQSQHCLRVIHVDRYIFSINRARNSFGYKLRPQRAKMFICPS